VSFLKEIIYWSILNLNYNTKKGIAITVIIMSILGFISTFTSISDVIPTEWTLVKRILASTLILLIIFIICFVGYCICAWFYNNKVKVFSSGNHSIYVLYGDIFSSNNLDQNKIKRNLIIPVNRCFDTIVDNDLISETRLHGMAMKRLYDNNVFTPDSLNILLQQSLKEKQIDARDIEEIPVAEKRKGNRQRWPVGTVVEVDESNEIKYFFLALSSFDKELHPKISKEEYILALTRLISYCNKRSQGYPVVMPLIGTGASAVEKDGRIALEYLLKLLKLHRDLIDCDFYIVVRDNVKDSISIMDL